MGDRMKGAMSEGLSKLGEEVSASLERARTTSDAGARVREKLVAKQMPRLRERQVRRAPRPVVLGGVAVAATLALGISLFARGPSRDTVRASSEKLTFVVGDNDGPRPGAAGAFLAASPASEMPLTFSDGSKVRLAPSARARVTEVLHSGARVLVESGDIHVSVVHRDDTKWWVEAGPFEVRVTGTKFDVHWDPEVTGLVVRLEEGAVYVRGCDLLGDEGRLLHAGEQLEVSCKDRVQHVRPIDSTVKPVPTAKEGESLTTISPSELAKPQARPATSSAPELAARADKPVVATALPSNAMDLARHGSHVEAIMAAEASGFASTCDSVSGPELLVLADSARYAGRFERAIEALEAARRRFPGTDAAATAAFELGRIAMDVRRDLAGGGDQFETYLRERPNGNLAREALGRALEARQRAGDNVRADPLASRYLAAYPDGPFAKLARKVKMGSQP